MTGQLLSGAPLKGLEALVVFDRPVYESYEQIAGVVAQRLGPQHAAVFARPELADGQIRWWAEVAGPARRWSELNAADRARLEPTRLQLGEEIARLTADLSRAGINTPKGNLSQILHAALEVPGIEHLYVVDDQPVLTFWGFRGAGGDGVNGLAPLPEAALAGALAPAARWWLWPWLLLAALLLALLAAFLAWWLLLRKPAVAPVPALPPVASRVETPLPREPSLPPTTTPPQEETIPPPQPPPETNALVPQRETVPGPLPVPKPVPPPAEPPPKVAEASPQPAPAAPGDRLTLPPDFNKDLRFLEGLWRSRTGLFWGNRWHKLPIEMFYRLGADGSGELLVRRPDGTYCKAPAFARGGDANVLSFETAGRPLCPDGSTMNSLVVQCMRLPDGAASCSGTNIPSGVKFAAELERADSLP
ncbi:MAG: hypothetical protein ACLQME_24245 [Alphaproteobacteria bacterium]